MPTVVNVSLNLLIASSAHKDFDLASMDIRAAFLKGNTPDICLHKASRRSENEWMAVEVIEVILWTGRC